MIQISRKRYQNPGKDERTMEDRLGLTIQLSERRKEKPAADSLGFGKYFTDHMLTVEYEAGKGWHNARIHPYQPILMDPAAKVFHYGQIVFEGLKAYRTEDGRVLLFRPQKNFERLNRSNERLSIPRLDENFMLESLLELVRLDKDWVPGAPGTSLYIRPFVIATEPALGLHPADRYLYMVIMSPSGMYYKEGIKPVKIYVEPEYVRAVRGGTGEAKTAGNYAASLRAQEKAEEKGFTQVLWLDGVERRYVEEVGSMNVFFKIGDTVVTPALNGSVLAGVTRDSVIQLLRHWGVKVEERLLPIDEVLAAARNGELVEAFGSGTAAVISPIGELSVGGETIAINGNETGELTSRLYDELTGIQFGRRPDPFGWTLEI
jgi:branched-chain amino acid aminotransferase